MSGSILAPLGAISRAVSEAISRASALGHSDLRDLLIVIGHAVDDVINDIEKRPVNECPEAPHHQYLRSGADIATPRGHFPFCEHSDGPTHLGMCLQPFVVNEGSINAAFVREGKPEPVAYPDSKEST